MVETLYFEKITYKIANWHNLLKCGKSGIDYIPSLKCYRVILSYKYSGNIFSLKQHYPDLSIIYEDKDYFDFNYLTQQLSVFISSEYKCNFSKNGKEDIKKIIKKLFKIRDEMVNR